jgi:hypothetical protein
MQWALDEGPPAWGPATPRSLSGTSASREESASSASSRFSQSHSWLFPNSFCVARGPVGSANESVPSALPAAPSVVSLPSEDRGALAVGLPLAAPSSQSSTADLPPTAHFQMPLPIPAMTFARSRASARRQQEAREENPSANMVLNRLEEPDSFVHSRSSLSSICGHFNSLGCHGPIGDMLDKYDTVFGNVPGSSLWNTKRPLTAAFTRWPTTLFFLAIACLLLYDSVWDMTSIVEGSRQAQCELHTPHDRTRSH